MIVFARRFLACVVLAAMAHITAAAESYARFSPGESRDNPDAQPFTQARWISPPTTADPLHRLPIFRKEFVVNGPIRRATLRIVGLGDYDARINGQRLADTGINQPWSQYEKTIYYRDFDITRHVQPGVNCVGVMLTNSFWHNPVPPAGRYNKDGPQLRCRRTVATVCPDRARNGRQHSSCWHGHHMAHGGRADRFLAYLCRRGF